jgi:hypothetical protein
MRKNIADLYKSATDARTEWVGRWRQCRRFAMPESDADNAALFDSTAADAADMLAANIFSLLTPPESAWLSLARESDLSPDPARPESALRAHLNESNFYTAIHQCYLDLVILGTACLFMAEAPIGGASAFSFAAIPMTDVAVLRDSADEITAVFHATAMPADEIAERYPSWTPPANLRRAAADNPAMRIRLVQSVVRKENRGGTGWDFTAWLDVGGDIENNIVATGEFATNPYKIGRASCRERVYPEV